VSFPIGFLLVVLVLFVALLLLGIFFIPMLIGIISNIMIILITIIASSLGPCSQLVLLVSLEELLLVHHLGEPSYEESHLIGIIFSALIIILPLFLT
jgi:hypothetical protein